MSKDKEVYVTFLRAALPDRFGFPNTSPKYYFEQFHVAVRGQMASLRKLHTENTENFHEDLDIDL